MILRAPCLGYTMHGFLLSGLLYATTTRHVACYQSQTHMRDVFRLGKHPTWRAGGRESVELVDLCLVEDVRGGQQAQRVRISGVLGLHRQRIIHL